ncbi:DUF3239 domain-containing protein [Corynebacterium sp. NML130628]|uniref:DUF3239 domain-containing protein n=1 Tax=Corynebacterium sp. NML130628 TaxID=1906333 RepID=UPI0008FB6BC4|nr:DUF3239 domain-containing protein [Corynebacterium sp. NML130628]OIR42172.1 hypothetical protein BJP07_08210 [Corynebacterium sp. NML130628]
MSEQPFRFNVDEEYAKEHNELIRNTKNLVTSSIALFVVCLTAGIIVWFLVDPASPWRLLGSLSLIFFGAIMLIVGLAIPRAVPRTQSIYDANPLAPAVITDDKGTTVTLTALVNMTVEQHAPAVWALTSTVVQRIPGVAPKVGAAVPCVAVGGQRTSRDKAHWATITPMPIAWGTPSEEVIRQATDCIPNDQWRTLKKAIRDTNLVKQSRNELVAL